MPTNKNIAKSDKLISKQQVLELIYPRLNSMRPGSIEYQHLYSIIQSIKKL